MVRCGDGQEFDIRTSRCKFVCKSEGVFPGDGCRKFYECVKVNSNTYNIVEGECPDGMKFDTERKSCVTGDCRRQ
jgi:hypothetical protein